MPSNGTAVKLPCTSELAPASVKPSEIERKIGGMVADAAVMTCAGAWEHEAGGMSPATRVQAGDLFVALFKLQEATLGELDFNTTAQREGRRVLQERYGN